MNEVRKRQFLFGGMAFLLVVFFSYAFYFVMGEVRATQAKYIDAYQTLSSLEEQQRKVNLLTKELAENSEGLRVIKEAFIEQNYDNKLKLVIDIENAAKSVGLFYELQITKELTKEVVVEERARQSRSLRQTDRPTEEPLEEKFPTIIFTVKLSGTYPAVVDFIEKLQRLPYYSKIESFTISGNRAEAEGVAEASIEFSVFTK